MLSAMLDALIELFWSASGPVLPHGSNLAQVIRPGFTSDLANISTDNRRGFLR